ncbi:MAG: hypothetical protein ACRDXX_18600 [Stackebrandtia sp.]
MNLKLLGWIALPVIGLVLAVWLTIWLVGAILGAIATGLKVLFYLAVFAALVAGGVWVYKKVRTQLGGVRRRQLP